MYKQSDYLQTIGTGTRTIAQDGSLIVAFTNLLNRLGFDLTPEHLNNYFTNKELYLNNDELTWNSVGQYSTVGIDVQTEMNEYSVVRIEKDGNSVYALVDNASANTVIDSADGTSKVISDLGQPKEFYAYKIYEPLAYNETKIEQTADSTSDDPTYTVVTPINGYSSSTDASTHGTEQVVVTVGSYYIFNEVNDMINVTPVQGQVGYWINPSDNMIIPETENVTSDASITAESTPVNEATDVTSDEDPNYIPVKVIPSDPNKWQKSYKPGLGMVEYRSKQAIVVHDLAGIKPDKPLPAKALVPVAGTFVKNDVTYARTVKSVGDDTWYGVPIDLISKSDNEDGDINDTINTINMELPIKVAAKTAGTLSRFSPSNLFKRKK